MPIGITSTTSVSVEATQKGFEAVGKAITDLNTNIQKTFGDSTKVTSRLTSTMDQMRGSIDAMSTSVKKTSDPFMAMDWSIKSITDGMMRLAQFQIRWYATRLILFDTARVIKDVAVSIVGYATNINQIRGEMLRWEASSGHLSATIVADTENIIAAIVKATTIYPVKIDELSKAVQAFVGAGLPYKTVEAMVPTIASLQTAFPEIKFEQFAIAATGALNVFRDSIKGVNTDAEKMKIIFDSLSAAQAKGVIRPEQFTKNQRNCRKELQ